MLAGLLGMQNWRVEIQGGLGRISLSALHCRQYLCGSDNGQVLLYLLLARIGSDPRLSGDRRQAGSVRHQTWNEGTWAMFQIGKQQVLCHVHTQNPAKLTL